MDKNNKDINKIIEELSKRKHNDSKAEAEARKSEAYYQAMQD